jgi:hypothetical protein
MTITDDIVKGLRNPTPLYAVAGTADLAAEKLREVPALIEKIREQAPDRFEKLRETDPKAVQERVTTSAKDAQSKFNETLSGVDLKELRDFKKLTESVQGIALQGVGRAAEYAVRTRETYDELAVRGKDAVAKWRGETADEVGQIVAAMEPKRESKSNPDSSSESKSAPRKAESSQTDAKPAAPKKPAARKTTAPTKPSDK